MSKGKLSKRRKARELAMQALYQWQMSGSELADIEDQFFEDHEAASFDVDYFAAALHGVAKEASSLDDKLAPAMTRSMASVDPVERAILRLAAWELSERLDIPYRVVINEAVELAKRFGATDGHKFVNGVLDKAVRGLRPEETASNTRN
jgi:N utilization substance protein B